jgi:hypothetical protein
MRDAGPVEKGARQVRAISHEGGRDSDQTVELHCTLPLSMHATYMYHTDRCL